MAYKVVKTLGRMVFVHDGVTMDVDHPGERAGVMTFHMPDEYHGFEVGDEVELQVRLKSRKAKENEQSSQVG